MGVVLKYSISKVSSSSDMKVLGLLFLLGSAYCGVPSCTTVWENKCWDEPRQKCDTTKVPHEVTSYEEKCTTVWDTEEDYEDKEECHTIKVPKTESVPEEKCETKYEEKCHTEYDQECHTRYSKECKTVYS